MLPSVRAWLCTSRIVAIDVHDDPSDTNAFDLAGPIVFVCSMNRCRSPLAELFWNHADDRSATGLRATSVGLDTKPGLAIHPDVRPSLIERGIDPDGFRSTQASPAIFRRAGVILTATRAQRSSVVVTQPAAANRTFVLTEFVALLGTEPARRRRRRPVLERAYAGRSDLAAREFDDIADPIGQGVDAIESTAALIDATVAELFDRIAASPDGEH